MESLGDEFDSATDMIISEEGLLSEGVVVETVPETDVLGAALEDIREDLESYNEIHENVDEHSYDQITSETTLEHDGEILMSDDNQIVLTENEQMTISTESGDFLPGQEEAMDLEHHDTSEYLTNPSDYQIIRTAEPQAAFQETNSTSTVKIVTSQPLMQENKIVLPPELLANLAKLSENTAAGSNMTYLVMAGPVAAQTAVPFTIKPKLTTVVRAAPQILPKMPIPKLTTAVGASTSKWIISGNQIGSVANTLQASAQPTILIGGQPVHIVNSSQSAHVGNPVVLSSSGVGVNSVMQQVVTGTTPVKRRIIVKEAPKVFGANAGVTTAGSQVFSPTILTYSPGKDSSKPVSMSTPLRRIIPVRSYTAKSPVRIAPTPSAPQLLIGGSSASTAVSVSSLASGLPHGYKVILPVSSGVSVIRTPTVTASNSVFISSATQVSNAPMKMVPIYKPVTLAGPSSKPQVVRLISVASSGAGAAAGVGGTMTVIAKSLTPSKPMALSQASTTQSNVISSTAALPTLTTPYRVQSQSLGRPPKYTFNGAGQMVRTSAPFTPRTTGPQQYISMKSGLSLPPCVAGKGPGGTVPLMTASGNQVLMVPAELIGSLSGMKLVGNLQGNSPSISVKPMEKSATTTTRSLIRVLSTSSMAQHTTVEQKVSLLTGQTTTVTKSAHMRPTVAKVIVQEKCPDQDMVKDEPMDEGSHGSGKAIDPAMHTPVATATYKTDINGLQLSGVQNPIPVINRQQRKVLQEPNGIRPRKPCNCTKSQCLKLYCDCFANGEFCYQCNCNCCANNIENEEIREKAIKSCLERNPQAFHPKIGKTSDVDRRHTKGCNCKRSGCLKNYCECYEGKIMCGDHCKCVGCKNYEDSVERRALMRLQEADNGTELRMQQLISVRNKLSLQAMGIPFSKSTSIHSAAAVMAQSRGVKLPCSFINREVVEATCQCLLAQLEEAESREMSEVDIEKLLLCEFGRCLTQIIDAAEKLQDDDIVAPTQ